MNPGTQFIRKPIILALSVILLVFLIGSALFLSHPGSASTKTTIRVLFIGNSQTYVNDLPAMIADLAKSGHHRLEHASATFPGYQLRQHVSDQRTLKKIKEGRWDYVVLQEQSHLPTYSQSEVEQLVYPYARQLRDLIWAASPQARIIFYMTVACRSTDPREQEMINYNYRALAQYNHALIAPVGEAWAKVRSQRPSLELYSDDIHPGRTGTYLAACVFYQVLFRESPVGLPHPSFLNAQDALYLQTTAASSTLNSKCYNYPSSKGDKKELINEKDHFSDFSLAHCLWFHSLVVSIPL